MRKILSSLHTLQLTFTFVAAGDITYFNPHCLVRDFSYDSVSQGSQAAVEEVLAQPDFGAMTRKAEAMLDGNPAIHNSGHGGIGGEMARLHSFFSSL